GSIEDARARRSHFFPTGKKIPSSLPFDESMNGLGPALVLLAEPASGLGAALGLLPPPDLGRLGVVPLVAGVAGVAGGVAASTGTSSAVTSALDPALTTMVLCQGWCPGAVTR